MIKQRLSLNQKDALFVMAMLYANGLRERVPSAKVRELINRSRQYEIDASNFRKGIHALGAQGLVYLGRKTNLSLSVTLSHDGVEAAGKIYRERTGQDLNLAGDHDYSLNIMGQMKGMTDKAKFMDTLKGLKAGKVFIVGEPDHLGKFKTMLAETGEYLALEFENRDYDDGKPRVMLKPIFKAGFIFKPSHTEIHYVKVGANLKRSAAYRNKFTTNDQAAQLFITAESAKAAIDKVLPKPDEEYHFTAVIENIETGDLHKSIVF